MDSAPSCSGSRSESAFLYVSDVSDAAGSEGLDEIHRNSRRRNAAEGITGLLMFDGRSFAQWVEGPVLAIDGLLARLRADPRHCRMDVLWFESPCLGRRFPQWHFGFLDARGSSLGIGRLRGTRGIDAMLLFGEFSRTFTTEQSFLLSFRRPRAASGSPALSAEAEAPRSRDAATP